jgi:tetratricopeptide (TPR) repeat protein
MVLRYCAHCHKSINDQNNDHDKDPIAAEIKCITCNTPLLYFGKASVKLSSQQVLAAYDTQNPYDPIAQFTGLYQNDPLNSRLGMDSIAVLECEEMLKYNDKNIEALLYLAKLYTSQKEFIMARRTIKKIIEIDPQLIVPWRLIIGITLYNEEWDEAVNALNQLQKLEPQNPIIYAHMGRVALQQEQRDTALICFYKSYINARSDNEKKRFKTIIQQLTTVLDDSDVAK